MSDTVANRLERLLITPFRTQNTPPPMASYVIDLPSTPVNASFSSSQDSLAVVFSDGKVQVWDLNTRLPDPKSGSRLRGGGKVAEPKLSWEADLAPEQGCFIAKQIAFGEAGVAVLFWTEKEDSLMVPARDGRKGVAQPLPIGAEQLIWGVEPGRWLNLAGGISSGELHLLAAPWDIA